jgi:hypothetical protein
VRDEWEWNAVIGDQYPVAAPDILSFEPFVPVFGNEFVVGKEWIDSTNALDLLRLSR